MLVTKTPPHIDVAAAGPWAGAPSMSEAPHRRKTGLWVGVTLSILLWIAFVIFLVRTF